MILLDYLIVGCHLEDGQPIAAGGRAGLSQAVGVGNPGSGSCETGL